MKKFKCIATRRSEKKGKGKGIKKQYIYESRCFSFEAPNFKIAVMVAEKIAQGLMIFESLTVREA